MIRPTAVSPTAKENFLYLSLLLSSIDKKRRTCQDQTVSAKRCARVPVDYTSYRGVRDSLVVGLIQIRGEAIVGIRCGRQYGLMNEFRMSEGQKRAINNQRMRQGRPSFLLGGRAPVLKTWGSKSGFWHNGRDIYFVKESPRLQRWFLNSLRKSGLR